MAGLASPQVLHPGWYREIEVSGVSSEESGLYEWIIEGVGCYIGQYTHADRPRREYGLNVARVLECRPYRKSKPHGFRTIHRELARAVTEGRGITLKLLENQPDKERRNCRERKLIAERRAAYASTNLRVLNGT
jgi:hypothetical protein